ncbi:MAG: VCBS repeat-containing protein, partial [Candidatus Hydrogenedentales bacterium]
MRLGVRGALAFLLLGCCLNANADVFARHGKVFKVGANVTAIVAADFDEDGLLEIVTADRGRLFDPREQRPGNDQLSYLAAEAPLQYVRKAQLTAGFGPYAIAVENIDALRAPDLIVANFLDTRNRDLTLLRYVGDGIFEPTQFSVPDEGISYARMRDGDDVPLYTTPGLTSVAVRDFDRDGYRDALATGWASDVLVYFPGDRTAYFKPPVLHRVAGGPRDIALGDFN